MLHRNTVRDREGFLLKLILIMTATVFGCLILISAEFNDFIFTVYSLVVVSIDKINPTRKSVFDHISKQLELSQIHSFEVR